MAALVVAAAGCTTDPPLNGAGSSMVGSSGEADGAGRDTAGAMRVVVSASATTVRAGDSLRIVVTATNTGSERRTVEATSGCFTDYEIRDASGRLAARSMQMCAAVMSRRELAPGEALRETFVWIPGQRGMPAVAPGSYELRGLLLQRGDTLRSAPVPVTVAADG